jgi:DNA repair protein RadA/Sms
MKHASFVCSSCGKPYVKWAGQCSSCGSWSTIVEYESSINGLKKDIKKPSLLSSIVLDRQIDRFVTSINEFDRVLGGGIVRNSAILLAGMPGVGKSTLLLMIADALANQSIVLYVSSEESVEQIKSRSERVLLYNSDKFFITHETDLSSILAVIESVNPDLVILDSLQNASIENAYLSMHINTIKQAAHMLVEHTRKFNYTLLCTCHVTKDGEIAGPKALEHIVDVILYFEAASEGNLRILRSNKNRFGRTDEAGFFIMQEKGIDSCPDPQQILIEHKDPTVGSALSWYVEGSRLFLVEVQALINQTRMGNPQRVIHGIDHKQLILVCAVLEKYLKIPLYEYDIFCKVSGSIKLKDSQTDLALAASLVSSYLGTVLKEKIVFSGEIGLSGDITSRGLPSSCDVFKRYGVNKVAVSQLPDQLKSPREIDIVELKSIYGLVKLFKS